LGDPSGNVGDCITFGFKTKGRVEYAENEVNAENSIKKKTMEELPRGTSLRELYPPTKR